LLVFLSCFLTISSAITAAEASTTTTAKTTPTTQQLNNNNNNNYYHKNNNNILQIVKTSELQCLINGAQICQAEESNAEDATER
jgi:hypothetical protein